MHCKHITLYRRVDVGIDPYKCVLQQLDKPEVDEVFMEEKFLAAVAAAQQKAIALGVRVRPVPDMKAAHRILSGHRESDGFYQLVQLGKTELTLEALAVKKEFTGLFTDEQANNALTRLLDAGYAFR